jgi:hypothetical protein
MSRDAEYYAGALLGLAMLLAVLLVLVALFI